MDNTYHAELVDIRPLDDLIDLDDLVSGTREIVVPWNGRDLKITIDLNRYDNPLQATLNRLRKLPDEDPKQNELTDAFILALAVSWNLRQPLSAESVARLPYPLRNKIVNAMQLDEAFGQGPKSAAPSPAASPGGPAGTSLNGIERSEPVGISG
jgi:hypothetical protein